MGNMEISESARMSAGFAAVREAFEKTYECLGINCAHIGGLIMSGTEYYEGFSPCGKVSKGSCYNANGDHKVQCDTAEADCGGSWYQPGFVSSRSGCCHCEGSCPDMSKADCKYYDAPAPAPAPAADDHDGHDHDDHDDPDDHDDAATTAAPTADGSIHMQSSSALVFGMLFLAYVGIS